MHLKNLIIGFINQQDLLNYYNVHLSYEPMPKGIYGCVFNYDNINFVLINKNISYKKRKKTLIHELAHIELNQLCQKNKDLFAFYIDKYEDEANEYINNIVKEINND